MDLKKEWVELFNKVAEQRMLARQSGSTVSESVGFGLGTMNVRPKDQLFGFLLDAISFRYVEMEKDLERAKSSQADVASKTDTDPDYYDNSEPGRFVLRDKIEEIRNSMENNNAPAISMNSVQKSSDSLSTIEGLSLLSQGSVSPANGSSTKTSACGTMDFQDLSDVLQVPNHEDVCSSSNDASLDLVSNKPGLDEFRSSQKRDWIYDTENDDNQTPSKSDTRSVRRKLEFVHNTKSHHVEKPTATKTVGKLETTQDVLMDFDKIPTRELPEPNFRYKEPTVRKKAERRQLQGHACQDCKGYYKLLESDMGADKVKQVMQRCSKHRSKNPPLRTSNTPPDFWSTFVPSTQELYATGQIKVANFCFTPPPRYVPRRSDEESDEDDDA